MAARRGAGILIKGGDAIERLAAPGTLLLDKTGTITEARVALAAWDGPEWVKSLVLALEQESSHPLADGFRRAFEGIAAGEARLTTHVAGGGIEGTGRWTARDRRLAGVRRGAWRARDRAASTAAASHSGARLRSTA